MGPAQMFSFLFGSGDSLRLPLTNGEALLLRDAGEHLDEYVNIPPQTGQQNGGNRSRVTVEMSPGVRLQVQAVE